MVAERETVMNYKHQNICELIRSFADEQNGAEGGPHLTAWCTNCVKMEIYSRLACCDHKHQRVPALSAEPRLVIALGICRALEYLHCKAANVAQKRP
jgi:hypothetical protein